MAKKPDLDDWCDELTAQLGRFHNWWRAQHVNDPEGFPYTLTGRVGRTIHGMADFGGQGLHPARLQIIELSC